MAYQVTLQNTGQIFTAKEGETLHELLAREGVPHNLPCGGNGTCGNCGCLVDGQAALLCQTRVSHNLMLELPESNARVRTQGLFSSFHPTDEGYHIAVDIGTTTVAANLFGKGRILHTVSGLNPQRMYGDDVISRIQFCTQNPEGTHILQQQILDTINEFVRQLSDLEGINGPRDITVVGNPTMIHLVAGENPAGIGVAPFTPVFLEKREYCAKELGLSCDCPVILPDGIASYVGSDLSIGMLTCGIYQAEYPSLYIDIGTNGEMALGGQKRILCCATAAGPAFEGAGLSCGMGAVEGAISSVVIEKNQIHYQTIGEVAAVGICGSGIIDLLAELLKCGWMDETGLLLTGERLEIAPQVYVTQEDLRKMQLAKGAIAAGIRTLLREMGISFEEIRHCYLAGGFGSYIRPESACTIGLLPKELLHKIVVCGNSALMGALSYGVSEIVRKEYQQVLTQFQYLELSYSQTFQEEFMDCMMFDHMVSE